MVGLGVAGELGSTYNPVSMLNPRPSQSLASARPLNNAPYPDTPPLPHPFLSLYGNGLRRVGRAGPQSPELLAHPGSSTELSTGYSDNSRGRRHLAVPV